MLSWALYHEKAFSDFCSLLSIGAAGSIGKTGVQIYDQLERRCHFCGRATIASGMQNLRDFCKPVQRSTEQCDSKCLSGSPCRSWRFSWQHSWNIHDANATTDLNVMQEVDGIRVYYTFMLQSLLPPPVWKKSVIWKGFMWMGFHL